MKYIVAKRRAQRELEEMQKKYEEEAKLKAIEDGDEN
jgi:hypothetical protein